jgi:hypothetical protein
MTVVICPDCGRDDVDETDLCAACSETFESMCDCLIRLQCDDCADDDNRDDCCGGVDDLCAANGCMARSVTQP